MTKLAIDLYCGLGGWAQGLRAEGFDVVGFDNERHRYARTAAQLEFGLPGESDPKLRGFPLWDEYPAQLVIQDVLTLHGSQFRSASVIVASPPCQEFSYMAMPWRRAKQIGRSLRGEDEFPAGYRGSRTIAELTALFDACFRIQREASEAAGHHIPLVVENVKGAQPWVGRAKWHYGSYYLWGDVPALMPSTLTVQKFNPDGTNHPQGSWFAIADSKNRGTGRKVEGFNFHQHEKNGKGGSFQSAAVAVTDSGHRRNPVNGDGLKLKDADGYERHHPNARGWKSPRTSSGATSARKAASAQIAKIPFPLAVMIAQWAKEGTLCA